MKTIDNIRNELERGYSLNVTKKKKDKRSYGCLTFMKHEFLISQCEEIEVNQVLKNFPHILKTLEENYHSTLNIMYDSKTQSLITKIQKEETKGPYCEEKKYYVLDDLQVKSKDIFMGLICLEEKIEDYVNQEKVSKKKVMVKVNG